jgi:AcrR family transcriptional regulator
VAKSGPRHRGRPTASDTGRARASLVEAAIEVIREEGFVGASARTIATRAGVNSAAVFYHFGSVNDLLLAALDATTLERLDRYRAATADVHDITELVRIVASLNREDYESGHVAVMAALVGGAAAIPGLGPMIAQRVEPWIELATEVIERITAGSVIRAVFDPAILARTLVSLFLGIELMARLNDDRVSALALFDGADKILALAAPLVVLAGTKS